MAINKNFVVRHGLEVDNDLIFANATTNKVGIASTTPRYHLDVRGGIGATDIYASGIGTFLSQLNVGLGGTILSANNTSYVGIGTGDPIYVLDVRTAGSAVTTAYIQGGLKVTGVTSTQNLSVTGISTFYNSSLGNVTIGGQNTALYVNGNAHIAGILTVGSSSVTIDGINDTITVGTGFTITSDGILMSSTGISTLPILVSSAASITNIYSSGVVTTSAYYIDGTQVIDNSRQLQNIASLDATTTATIEAAIQNAPNNFDDLYISGISTLGTVKVSSGIITATSGIVTYYGDGSNLDGIVAFSTISNSVIGGIASVSQISVSGLSTFLTGPLLVGSATSTGNANQKLQVTGDSYVSGYLSVGEVNPTSNLHVIGNALISGIITSSRVIVGSAVTITSLDGITLSGNINASGVTTTSSLVSNSAIVGSAVTINSSGINVTGVTTTSSLVSNSNTFGSAVVGSAVTINSSGINVTGVTTTSSLVSNSAVIGGSIVNLSSSGLNVSGATTTLSLVSDSVSVGVITAISLVKVGGSSTEFLKADGSIDSNEYATVQNAVTLGRSIAMSIIFGY